VFPVPVCAELPSSVYDVTAYGAKSGGAVNNARAIQKAIDACALAGGGTVYFPAGNFLSGTIVLKSNVTLHFSPGATLAGSREMGDYNPPYLIYAQNAENIGIEGSGTIYGNGDAFWESDFKAKAKRPDALIRLERCRGVRIRDIRIRNTPKFGIHPVECDGVNIRGISMISDMRGPNTDGIDPESSRNVMISDSYIETGDDAICLKSHTAPTENVTVTNCVLISDDSALKVGTGTYSDVRNCVFSNCVITGTHLGITMFLKDGGTVEGLHFSNININTSVEHYNRTTHSSREWNEYPIFIDLEKRNPQSKVSRLRDVTFGDIQIQSKGRILVAGMPERPLENLGFRNILMRVPGFEAVEQLHKPRGVHGMPLAPREMDYSSATAALIFANIRGLALRDVRVAWDAAGAPQDRHAVYVANVEDLSLIGFAGSPAGSKLAAIGLDCVKNVFVTQSRTGRGTTAFLGLHDTPENEIALTDNDLRSVRPVAQGATYVHIRK
jgi:polygalacturonase